jgi:inhibitor of KinA sporulation pathway (predicted exonuclease)
MSDFILYDTEFTAWKGCNENGWDASKGQYTEIVQIGAILVDGKSFEEKISLNIFIKPKINPQLSDYFKDLTHITQETVDKEGWDLEAGLKIFSEFCLDFQIPVFSYGLDERVVGDNYELIYKKQLPFAGKTNDIRKIVETFGVDTTLYSSGTLTECLGKGLLDYPHDAVNDVRSIRHVLHHFFKENKVTYDQLLDFYGCVGK